MTNDRDREADDDALEGDIVRALAERGELIPTTEAEVLAAEQAGVADLELPERLRRYDRAGRAEALARASERAPVHLRPLPVPRRALGYAVSTALGALAAGLALTWLRKAPPPVVTSAGSELAPSSSHAPHAKPLVTLSDACEKECCGGSACGNAPAALKACPSGQRCISCNSAEQPQGPYRLRFGTMILSEAGEAVLEPKQGVPLDLCVSMAGTDIACLPALSDDTADDSWRLLDRVSSTQDLLSGLTVEVRRHGTTDALASWKHPVATTPDVFCKGLLIQPTNDEKIVGRLSVFVEQTHFVELERAASVASLLAFQQRFEFRGVTPSIRETAQPDSEHFALVLGPLSKAQAESVRWSLLDGGSPAKTSYGLDFVGQPRQAP
jgi:hypothetical protein